MEKIVDKHTNWLKHNLNLFTFKDGKTLIGHNSSMNSLKSKGVPLSSDKYNWNDRNHGVDNLSIGSICDQKLNMQTVYSSSTMIAEGQMDERKIMSLYGLQGKTLRAQDTFIMQNKGKVH